ncbi:MAG TPA: hypothetical protein VH062_29205 [Polyangiaceae bacterium]|nr:hypothetical protein [Polyangiaceae bacterium]
MDAPTEHEATTAEPETLSVAVRWTVGVVSAGALAAVAWILSRRPLTDYDLPWNLAMGRVVVATRSIPRVDDLAFTHGPLRYVEVLGDTFFYGVEHTFHERGLQWVGALAAAGTVAATFARMRKSGPVAYLVAAWLAAATAQWFTVRPATLSLLFLPLGLLVVDRHRERPSDWKRLLPLVPLAFVWANVHGMVALFAALLVAYAVVSLFESRRSGAGTRRTSMAVVACALAALSAASVNTFGPALLLGPLRGDEVLGGITEWARPSLGYFFADVPVATAFVVFALLAVGLGREPDGRRALPLFDVVVLALALAGFVSVVRLTPLAAILVAPLAARRLGSWIPETNLVGVAAAVAPAAAAAYVALFIPTTELAGFDPTRFPVAATNFVERMLPAGRMYDFMPFGGYLAYRLHPTYRVFNDGRNTLARSADFVKRAERAGTDAAAFDGVVRNYGLEWAMTTSKDREVHDVPLARSAEWQMVFLDDVAAVYVRREGPNAKLARYGYRALRHLVEPAGLLRESMHDGPVATALGHDGALALLQAPDSPRACFIAAVGGIAAKDASLFGKGVEQLARLSPSHPALSALENAWSVRNGRP